MSKDKGMNDNAQAAEAAGQGSARGDVISLDGETRAKFVLFAVPPHERADGGPVMRGLLETEQGKVSVAGWKCVARETGTEYLSLKVGNTKPRPEGEEADAADDWNVGPLYGRLFREVTTAGRATKTRYFGYIEESVRIGEDDETGKGVYRTAWQVQIRAKPNVSRDGKTHYIDGTVAPIGQRAQPGESALPF